VVKFIATNDNILVQNGFQELGYKKFNICKLSVYQDPLGQWLAKFIAANDNIPVQKGFQELEQK